VIYETLTSIKVFAVFALSTCIAALHRRESKDPVKNNRRSIGDMNNLPV
jgi:hypothetical protein